MSLAEAKKKIAALTKKKPKEALGRDLDMTKIPQEPLPPDQPKKPAEDDVSFADLGLPGSGK
jgi:hypothetical protein